MITIAFFFDCAGNHHMCSLHVDCIHRRVMAVGFGCVQTLRMRERHLYWRFGIHFDCAIRGEVINIYILVK